MGAYKYLVALVILLLVNKSLARPVAATDSQVQLGGKTYYFETVLKANWYKALQYCRSHSMHLANITSQEVNDRLERHINDVGLGEVRFWTSGTDQAEEETFVWMANGNLVVFKNWWAGEPNNSRDLDVQGENCLHLWNMNGIGWQWNDASCEEEKNFICELE